MSALLRGRRRRASNGVGVRTEDYCEERIARYLELAEAAQDAAGRARYDGLRETYTQLARQWIELARMAERTIVLVRQVSRPIVCDTDQDLDVPQPGNGGCDDHESEAACK